MAKQLITIELDCNKQEAEKYKNMIIDIINQGALNVMFGSSTLHFHAGDLKAIDLNIKQWHVDKNKPFILKIKE